MATRIKMTPAFEQLEQLSRLPSQIGEFTSGAAGSFISNKVSPYSPPTQMDKEGKRYRIYNNTPISTWRKTGEDLGIYLRNPSLWLGGKGGICPIE